MNAVKISIANDARLLSSGTIANMTGLRQYDDIDQVQARFVQFTIDHPGYETWQDAWAVFWQRETSCLACAHFHLNHPDLPERWQTGHHGLCLSPAQPRHVEHQESMRCGWFVRKE